MNDVLELYLAGEEDCLLASWEMEDAEGECPCFNRIIHELFFHFGAENVTPATVARQLLEYHYCGYSDAYDCPEAIEVATDWLVGVKRMNRDECKKMIIEKMNYLRPLVKKEIQDELDEPLTFVGLPTTATNDKYLKILVNGWQSHR